MKRGTVEHTKFKKLRRRLRLSDWGAAGVLTLLWQTTAREAPRGDIGRLSNEDIATAIDWNEDADEFVLALVSCGWIDEHPECRLVIHDWPDHCEDSVHVAIARRRQVFANGELPRTARLSKTERDRLEQERAGEHSMSTESAQKRTESAQKRTESAQKRTESALPCHGHASEGAAAKYLGVPPGRGPAHEGTAPEAPAPSPSVYNGSRESRSPNVDMGAYVADELRPFVKVGIEAAEDFYGRTLGPSEVDVIRDAAIRFRPAPQAWKLGWETAQRDWEKEGRSGLAEAGWMRSAIQRSHGEHIKKGRRAEGEDARKPRAEGEDARGGSAGVRG